MVVGYSDTDYGMNRFAVAGQPITRRSVASFTFKCPVEFENLSDYQICEKVFAITNQQSGKIWDSIKDNLPQERTHTSLSVGDEVVIQKGRNQEWIYECADLGFVLKSSDWSLV